MPRVVFLPGVMGSILRDDTIPANFCSTDIAPRIKSAAQRAGVNPAVQLVLDQLLKLLCKLDVRVIWGSLDMLPWVFAPDLWCKKLTQGDGQITGGSVAPNGLESIQDSYTLFLSHLRSVADVLELSYDWRLSNDVNAARLEGEILRKWWKGIMPSEAVKNEERVAIVAHSMGGLVSRNFIEARIGHRLASRLITVGTPHNGAPESYSGFHRIREPFAKLIDLDVVARLLARAGITLPLSLRRILIPTVMPIDMQVELFRTCSSVIQLLPNFNFVSTSGTSELFPATYGAMRHIPTGKSVADTIDLLRHDFKDKGSGLNPWLRSVGARYFTLASNGLSTVQRFEADRTSSPTATGSFRSCRRSGAVRDVFRQGLDRSSDDGDGTVPFTSAAMHPDSNIFPIVFNRIEHGKLLQNLAVRNACYRILGVATVTRESEYETLERMGFGSESEMEMEYLELEALPTEAVGLRV